MRLEEKQELQQTAITEDQRLKESSDLSPIKSDKITNSPSVRADTISTHTEMDEEWNGAHPGSVELRMVLVGTIDCGKTLTADNLLGQKSSSSSSSRSCILRRGLSHSRRLTLVEGPRWYWSSGRLESSVQEETKRALSLAAPGPHAFLLLIPVNQFTEMERRAPRELEEMFGRGVLQHTLVVLTCGDYLLGRMAEEYLAKEDEGLREVIKLCEGRYHVMNNRQVDNREQVKELLEKVERMVQQKGGCYVEGIPLLGAQLPSLTTEVEVEVVEMLQSQNTEQPWSPGGLETDHRESVQRTEIDTAETQRRENERAEQERLEREKVEQERCLREKAEQERLEREREEDRLQKRLSERRAKRERERRERELHEKAEMERIEKERVEKERILKEREREESERKERERLKKESGEKRLKMQSEMETAEKERAETERIIKEIDERERKQRERLEKEREERRLKLRAEMERIENDSAERERILKEREETRRVERERLKKEREEKRLKMQAEMERIEKERAERERIIKERDERERKERGERRFKMQAEIERIEKEKAETERIIKEREERRRVEREQLEKDRAEEELKKLEMEKREKEEIKREQYEKADMERKGGREELQRIIKEKEEKERQERERSEIEGRERIQRFGAQRETIKERRERLQRARAERERLEQEMAERESAEAGENERTETEQQEQERREKERIEKERVEKERERLEQERLEREKEKQRIENMRLEKEKAERVRAEKESREREMAKKERLEKERAEKERMQRERAEKEKQEIEERAPSKHMTNGVHSQMLPQKQHILEQQCHEDKQQRTKGSSQSTAEGAILSQVIEPGGEKTLKNIYHRITTGEDPSPSAPELRLVLLGCTRSGKSAAGNAILGRREFESQADSAVTQRCEKGRAILGNRRVAVVDTPDWFRSECSPEEVRSQLSSCIAFSTPGPHAFLFCVPLHRSPDPAWLQALGALEGVFGPGAVKDHTLLLFTHSDCLEKGAGGGKGLDGMEEYIASKRPDLLKLVEKCGDRYHILERARCEGGGGGGDEEERRSVEHLLEKVEQMVKESGGGHYSCPLYQEAENRVRDRHEELLQDRRERTSRGGVGEYLDTLEEEEEDEALEVERTRDEAEKSVTLDSVPALTLPPSESTSFLRSVGQKVTAGLTAGTKMAASGVVAGAKKVPKPLAGGALLGAGLGAFFGGLLGGAVGATGGVALAEVVRRKLNSRRTDSDGLTEKEKK